MTNQIPMSKRPIFRFFNHLKIGHWSLIGNWSLVIGHLILFFVLCSLFFILPALAQNLNTGLEYGAYTGLVDTDIRIIVARIIRAALGLLGMVALAFVIYGGYEYMTAAGNEEQISKAKKILINAAIGLVIILSAFAITQFVISKLTDAIIGDYTSQYCQQNPTAPECAEYCAQHPVECSLPPLPSTIFYSQMTPQGQQTIKNVTVSILFFGNFGAPAEYDASTVPPLAANIRVVKKSGQTPALGNFSLISASRIDFNPTGSCLDPDNPANSDHSNACFEKNTAYQVILTSAVKSKNKLSLECSAAHPCNFEFITGEKIDKNPPAVSLVLPGNNARLAVSTNVDVSANYSDDAGVKLVSFFQGAAKIRDVLLNPPVLNGQTVISWFTGASAPATYELKAMAGDVDNHETASAIQTVLVLPAHCFDTMQNADETGIDCGGVCGACVGQTCQTNLDCAGTYCDLVSHTCVVRPKVTNVDPKDGQPGNYITIFGKDFGNSQIGARVVFLGDPANSADDKIAEVVSCFGKISWQDNFIVAKVPVGAANGPLQVRTSSYSGATDLIHQDRSNDDWGPIFPTSTLFIINTTARPGLCGINPAKEEKQKTVAISGSQLGDIQGSSQFQFGDYLAEIISGSWSSSGFSAKVPTRPAQKLTVKAVVNSQSSNSLPFEILPESAWSGPHLDYLDPTSGPLGAYLTIFGQNFGIATGKVTFKQGSQTFNADPLPSYCGNPWATTQIVVKVPQGLNLGTAEVRVISNQGVSSDNSKIYTIDLNKKQANLCQVKPDNGPKGTAVTLKGEGFAPSGSANGRVVFSPFDTYAAPTSHWTDKIISGALTPDQAKSGPLQTITYGAGPGFPFRSNSLYFKIQNCQTDGSVVCGDGTSCCANGSCLATCPEATGPGSSIYAWSFSTGKMPIVPKVIEACKSGQVPSPTPSQFWPPYENVCINAQIKVQFNNLINDATIDNNSFLVESCAQNCSGEGAVWSPVSGYLDFSLTNGGFHTSSLDHWVGLGLELSDTVGFRPATPDNLFSKNKWYRVILTTDIKSLGWNETANNFDLAANMPAAPAGQCVNPAGQTAAYCFSFKTQDSDELCKLGSAVVSPDPFTAAIFNHTYYPEEDKTLYHVTAMAQDNICWVINAPDYDWKWNTGEAAADTMAPYADVTNEKANGKGKPEQDLITKNTEVSKGKVWARTESGGQDSAILNISPAPVQIAEHWPACPEACINAAIGARFNMEMYVPSLNKTNINLRSCNQVENCLGSAKISDDDFNLTTDNQGFGISYSLSPNQYYQVFITGGDNGVKSAVSSTMKEGFSWIFKTKNDATKCDVDRVEIYPASATVYWVGDKAVYRSLPYGPKDNCAPKTGQLLNASGYNWAWSSANVQVATVTNLDLAPSTSACSANCLILPPKPLPAFCPKDQTVNCCGNGTIDEANNEECELGNQGCDGKCQLAGSSYLYNPPSYCGDTVIGIGEACEPDSVKDNNVDPKQYAIAQSPTTFQQGKSAYLTQIFAQTLNLASQSKQGQADFILQCGYQELNANCPTASDLDKGVGSNSCCYWRPTVEKLQPAIDSNVCPNTAIRLKFDQLMDINSFSSSTLGYYNIILAEATSTAQCPIGQFKVAEEIILPQGFWQKIVHFIRHLFGQPAQAEIFCAGGIDYSLSPETIMECPAGTSEQGENPTCTKDNKIVKTQVSLILKKPLAGLKNYKILVAHPWVKSSAGVSMKEKKGFGFGTRKDICKIDKIGIDPTAWWFNTLKNEADDDPADIANFDTKDDVDKVLAAQAYFKGSTNEFQEIQPVSGYTWNYSWSVGDTSIVQRDATYIKDAPIDSQAKIVAQNKNGATQVGAMAKVVKDQSTFSASSTVQVFICENLWPDAVFNPDHPAFGLGYVDAEGTDDKVLGGDNLDPGRGWTNFKLMYCRDYGQGDKFCLAGSKAGQTCSSQTDCGDGQTCAPSTADDLAALRLPTVLYHDTDPKDPIFKEFFFTFDSANNKNSLGWRIYQNLEHKSLIDWYNSQDFITKGAPVPAKVGSYEALQDGRTYYISGVNLNGNNLYSNIYVFSFSDNPTAETLNVVNQLLTNFTLNVNVISQEDKDAFYRDFQRLQDFQLITGKLQNYYANHNNSYPKLTENPQLGTYLPSYTNSKWKSWQGVLGNLLEYTLPVDPINKFVSCGSEDIPSGLYSWWKAEGDTKDAVGSHHGELINGAAFEQGKTGQAFKFDGTDDYVKISDTTNPPAYTVVAWVKPSNTGNMNIFVRTDDSGPTNHWSHQLRIKNNKFEHYLYDSVGKKSVMGLTSIIAGQWYQIVGVASQNDNPLMKLYVNGKEEGTASSIGTLWAGGNAYQIGSDSGDGMGFFSGSIDDVQLYHRALSDSEIKKLYAGAMFDSETCWNAAESKFICPSGSHIYQYETKGGEEATLKADFERPDYQWVNDLPETISPVINYSNPQEALNYYSLNNYTVRHWFNIPSGYPDFNSLKVSAVLDCDGSCAGQIRVRIGNSDSYKDYDFIGADQIRTDGTTSNYTAYQNTYQLSKADLSNSFFVQLLKFTGSGTVRFLMDEGGPTGPYPEFRTIDNGDATHTGWTKDNGDYFFWVTLPFGPLSIETKDTCTDVIQGISSKCGDGIVGLNEKCEIGQTDYLTCSVGGYGGKQLQKCGNDCKWGTPGVCVPQGKCGDGIVQKNPPPGSTVIPEQCDDGKNNGKYGYCSSDCKSFGGGGYCGNGQIDMDKEICDLSSKIQVDSEILIKGYCQNEPYAVCYFPPQTSSCKENAKCVAWRYERNKLSSCSWDCQSYDYCGDGKINNDYEECEESKPCQVGVCSDKSPQVNKYCEKDDDCTIGISCAHTGYLQRSCTGGGINNGKECSSILDCTKDIRCLKYESGKQYCNVPGEKYPVKLVDSTGWPYFQDATSTSPLVYPDSSTKTCDWDSNNITGAYFANPASMTCLPFKAPEPVYSPINCGNGKIDAGEVCDSGSANGDVCTFVDPASTCTYCAFGCQQVITVSK